jgi:hypothetical protein
MLSRSRRLWAAFAFSFALGLVFAGPVSASEPVFAASNSLKRYWDDFSDYWTSSFRNKSAITLTVLGVGAVAMFIVTRGKWQK